MHDNSGYLAQSLGQQRLTFHFQLPLHNAVTPRRHAYVTSDTASAESAFTNNCNSPKTTDHRSRKESRSVSPRKHKHHKHKSAHLLLAPDPLESDVISRTLDSVTTGLDTEESLFLPEHASPDDTSRMRKRAKVRRSNGSASGHAAYRLSGRGRKRSESESSRSTHRLLRSEGKIVHALFTTITSTNSVVPISNLTGSRR